MKYDAVIIGAGHNGLVTGVQLANQGKRVLVIEKEQKPGGAAKSGEVAAPGFVHDLFSMNISLFLKSRFYQENEKELSENGFIPVKSDRPFSSVYPDGTGITVYTDKIKTYKSIARHSKHDAYAWKDFDALYDQVAPYLFKLMNREIPSLSAGFIMMQAFIKLKLKGALEVGSQVSKSPRQFVDSWFENDKVKSLIIPWGYQMDFAPDITGGAVFPLIEAIGNYRNGVPFARGGVQSMIRAMVIMLEKRGGEIKTGTYVKEIAVENKKATGVIIDDGTFIEADTVIGTLTPTQILRHVDTSQLPDSFIKKAEKYQYGPKTMVIHLAMDKPLAWTAGEEVSKSAYVHIGPYVQDIARTHTQALNQVLPDSPLLIVGQPSVIDETRAPKGKSAVWVMVRSLPTFPQSDARNEIEAGPWDSIKEQYAERVLDKLEEYAPNVRKDLAGINIFSPADLERHNPNLNGGDHMAGSHQMFQHFVFRPVPGFSRYQTPIMDLYMIGASTWPGGGLNAGSGYILGEKLNTKKKAQKMRYLEKD